MRHPDVVSTLRHERVSLSHSQASSYCQTDSTFVDLCSMMYYGPHSIILSSPPSPESLTWVIHVSSVVYVFQSAGITGRRGELISSSVQYVLNVVMTVPAIIYIDKWGRRPMLV